MSLNAALLSPSTLRRRRFAVVRRALTVASVATAVTIGSASAVLAAPASAPVAEVTVSESLQPVLHGKATAAGSGAQRIAFYARTVGSTTWNLLDNVSVAGTDAYLAIPAGRLAVADLFEYQTAHCDDTGCATSAVKTGTVSPALGAGPRSGATRIPFTIGDGISAQVDVGTGNLMVSTNAFSLERANANAVDVGVTYNSITRSRGESHFKNAVGPTGSGWRLSTGSDVRLRWVSNGTVIYSGENGLTGAFKSLGNDAYETPDGIKMDLTGNATSGWTLEDHGSGEKRRFSSSGTLEYIADRNDNRVTFAYGSGGTLASITTDKGPVAARTLSFTSTADGARIAEITQTPAAGSGESERSVSFEYDANDYNRLLSVTDRLGRKTEFYYTSSQNLNRITAPGGAQTSFNYDGKGRVTVITQPTADPLVNAVTRINYGTGTKTLVADPNSDQAASIWAAAHTTYELTTDGNKLVSKTIDPAGNERSKTYTPFMDVATSTNSAGTTTFGHDEAVNGGESLTSIKSATGAGSSFQYQNTSARFQPSSVADAQGNKSDISHDEFGNRLGTTKTDGSASAEVTRNDDGTVKTSKAPNGAVTNFGYDGDKQLTSITPPTGNSLGVRTYTYDGFGRIETYTGGRGVTETYIYDDQDRVTEVAYSDGTPSVRYTYNTAGQVQTRADASGLTTYTYDPLGRLASRIHTAGGGLLNYAYDRVGNVVSETDAGGTTRHTYDSRNLLTKTVTADGQEIAFGHDKDGKRVDTWFATNAGNTAWAAHTHSEFDGSGRITRVWTARASADATQVSDLSYSYASPGTNGCATAPPAGQDTSLRWKKTDNVTGQVTTYCYDTSNRLTAASTPGGDSWVYAYDMNGNRTRTTKNGIVVQNQTVNNADQLTGAAAGYKYDANGNQTGAPSAVTMGYNGSQQMTSRTSTSGYNTVTARYTYAGSDQTELISQVPGSGGTYNYTYGRTDRNELPILESITNSNGNSYLTHDNSGVPLALKSHTGNYAYYVLDGLGSPIALINGTGILLSTFTYDPYGQVTADNITNNSVTALNPYRFAGGMYDRSSNLVKFGMRWYDPATGRFTQQDSVETLADPSRANRYEYAAGNPCNFVDPTGQDISDCGIAVIAFAGSALQFIGGVGVILASPATGPFAPAVAWGGVALLGTGLGTLALGLSLVDDC